MTHVPLRIGGSGRLTAAQRTTTPAGASSLLSDLAGASLLLLTVLTISRVHQYVGVIGRMRPALLLFGLAVVGAVFQARRMNLSNLVRFWPGRVMVALGAFACISAPFGISFGSSASFILEYYAKVLLYGMMLIVTIRSWEDLRRLVWAFVIGVGILAWISVVVVGISKTRSNATFDANDVGLLMIVGIPLAIITLQTSKTFGKLTSLGILGLAAITVARSMSRGAFVGLVVVGLGVLLTLRTISVARRTAILIGAVGALFLAAPDGYWDLIYSLKNPTTDYNWASRGGRKELAKRGLAYMMDRPVFGLGIHNFMRAEGTISEHARNHTEGTGLRWSAPHNSYAEVGAELGVPGMLLWGSLIFGGIIGMRRLHKRLPQSWRTGAPDERFLYSLTSGLPVALAGFGVTSFFVSFAYLDPIYILTAMNCGAYLCVASRLPPSVPLRRGQVSAPAPAAPVVAAQPRMRMARQFGPRRTAR